MKIAFRISERATYDGEVEVDAGEWAAYASGIGSVYADMDEAMLAYVDDHSSDIIELNGDIRGSDWTDFSLEGEW